MTCRQSLSLLRALRVEPVHTQVVGSRLAELGALAPRLLGRGAPKILHGAVVVEDHDVVCRVAHRSWPWFHLTRVYLTPHERDVQRDDRLWVNRRHPAAPSPRLRSAIWKLIVRLGTSVRHERLYIVPIVRIRVSPEVGDTAVRVTRVSSHREEPRRVRRGAPPFPRGTGHRVDPRR